MTKTIDICNHKNKKHVGYHMVDNIEVFWCVDCKIFVEEIWEDK